MRLYALLALCACAHAATIGIPERKLDDLDNVDLDNVVSEPELIDQANTIKDVDNNLRNALGIPVKVIEDVKNIEENSNDYVPDSDSINVKRVPIDLNNPGEPQRQQHETQNPESYTDAQKAVFAIKQTIEDTQKVFTNGLKGISENFNRLFANNEQLSTIQQNIQNLKSSFNEQVLKLNNTIKSYINPDKIQEADEEVKAVQTRLRVLESNFKTGVHTLSEGVELLAIIKEEDEAGKAEGDATTGNQNPQPASTTQPPVTQSNNPVMQFLYNFQQGVANSFAGLNNAVQNYFNQGQNPQNPPAQTQQTSTPQGGSFVGNLFQGIQLPFGGQQGQQAVQPSQGGQKPPGAAADEPAQTGWRPPNIIQQVQTQWNNLVNGGQNTQTQRPPQDFFNQAFQNIVNVFSRPNTNNQNSQTNPPANQPTGNNAVPSSDVPQGANIVPANPVPQLQAQPAQQQVVQPIEQVVQIQPVQPVQPVQNVQPVQPAAVQTQSGAIQQLVQNNPIIKGLQTVAKRITNPERPRDTIDEKADSKGHGGWGEDHSGDNTDDSRIEDEPENLEKIEETPMKFERQEETFRGDLIGARQD